MVGTFFWVGVDDVGGCDIFFWVGVSVGDISGWGLRRCGWV